jgi:hypothetical protein
MTKTGPAGQAKHPLFIPIIRMNLVSPLPCRLACSAKSGDNCGITSFQHAFTGDFARMSARLPFNRKSPADKAEQRRAEINTINRHGTNLFFQAVESGKLHDVANMIDDGADLDARTTSRGMLSNMMVNIPYGVGATPLHAACLLGSVEIVQYLLKKGADPHATDEAGHTPMDYALLSHSFFEDELNRKEQSRFAFRSTVNKAAARVEDYDNVIAQLLARKAKPGMFELPERFRMARPGGSLPPAPPLP